MTPPPPPPPHVLLVGAGPAGVISAVALIGRGCRITWVDSKVGFDKVGRMGNFCNVHANTKIELVNKWFSAGLLGDYINQFPKLQELAKDVVSRAKPAPFPDYGDPTKGLCMLGDFVNVLRAVRVQLCLSESENIEVVHGRVTAADLKHNGCAPGLETWTVQVTDEFNNTLTMPHKFHGIVLGIGALPAPLPKWCADLVESNSSKPRVLSGEVAVDAEQLTGEVIRGEKIALLGTSHSAALVAMHLQRLGWTSKDLTVYSNSRAKQAKWISPGTYLYSGSGLKGVASAYFADELRKPESEQSPLLHHLNPNELEDPDTLRKFDVVIPTIGYRTAPLPKISVDGSPVITDSRRRDPATSRLLLLGTLDDPIKVLPDVSQGKRQWPLNNDGWSALPGIFGLGIGWPDYFEKPEQPNDATRIGFGGESDPRQGVAGEHYVGLNAKIARAGQIAESIAARVELGN